MLVISTNIALHPLTYYCFFWGEFEIFNLSGIPYPYLPACMSKLHKASIHHLVLLAL